MRTTNSETWLTRIALAATVIVLVLGAGACGQAKDFIAKQSKESEARVVEDQEAAAQNALEAERLAEALRLQEEEALRQAEAAAQAEADAQVAREAQAAAERRLAEKEALLAQREEELRRQRALQEEKDRLAAHQAALEEKERLLFEQERELEAREVNVAVAEDELRTQAAEDPLGANARAYEPAGWTNEVIPVDGDGEQGEDHPDQSGETEDLTEPAGYPATATLQPGKVMEVEILETLSSRTHRLGDTFSGRLVQDLRAEDGTLVVAAGAEVEGEVVEVTPLKVVGGRASIAVEFTRIILAPGESVEIRASISEMGADRSKDKKKIIGATIAGAILGRVIGGKGGENAVIGAAAGAAAGSAAVARGKGKDAVIPAGEMVALQLEEVVTVQVDYGGTVDPE